MLRNPLAETLAAGHLGIAMIVQKVHAVDTRHAALVTRRGTQDDKNNTTSSNPCPN